MNIPMFNRKDLPYLDWKYLVEMGLEVAEYWDSVVDLKGPGEPDARTKWIANNRKARALVILALDPSLISKVAKANNVLGVFAELDKDYLPRTTSSKVSLKTSLFNFVMKTDNMRDGLVEFGALVC